MSVQLQSPTYLHPRSLPHTPTTILYSDAPLVIWQRRSIGPLIMGSYADLLGGRYDQSWTTEAVRDGVHSGGEIEFC